MKLAVEEVRNKADLRMYLAHVARRHVTLELSMEDFETQLEREFHLAPFRLRGELLGLDELLRRSKDIYAAAIAKFQTADAAYRDVCNIADVQPSRAVRQSVDQFEELYKDAVEAHRILRSMFASEWVVWKTVDHGATELRVPAEGKAAPWLDRVVDPGHCQ